uniref:Uncharacterized protein n=1 Tax=Peronospora matthiolae TaxID=2874970 RepID=A0AAV1UQH8_9STRA
MMAKLDELVRATRAQKDCYEQKRLRWVRKLCEAFSLEAMLPRG